MKCGSKISTGYPINPMRCGPDDTALMAAPGKVVLFSPETRPGTIYSRSFTVNPGEAIIIDTYNMPDNGMIYVNRLVKSTTGPTTGDTCDPCAMDGAYGTDGRILFREKMTLGGQYWGLGKHFLGIVQQPILQLIVMIPGTYELELSNTDMLGDMEVEYMVVPLASIMHMPAFYYPGNYKVAN